MTAVEDLAAFAATRTWDDLSAETRDALKVRVLDSVGCAVGALGEGVPWLVRDHVESLNHAGRCTLVAGGRSAPDRAALANGALVRYLDFNDAYLAPGETCHPSDNLAAILAAAEYADRSGRELLVALAVAYQVQSRLSDVAPLRAKGFDHTVQLAFATAAGTARALGLDPGTTAHAVAIAGTALWSLRVTRTGAISQWKGLAAPFTTARAVEATLLAGRGITGPLAVFEGDKGLLDVIGESFAVDWPAEKLDYVGRTALKRFNAEIHAQSAIEVVLDLRARHGLDEARLTDVRSIEIETFLVAYDIIGDGGEGTKRAARTREEADHSLSYLVAVALLDGQVLPEQLAPERIVADDVQALLRCVAVRASPDLTDRFPTELPCRVRISLNGGEVLTGDTSDYQGWPTRPMSWDQVVEKFERLAGACTSPGLRDELITAVSELERIETRELTQLLSRVSGGRPATYSTTGDRHA